MAIQTLPFADFGNGAVLVTFDYNDQNGNVVRFRCANNSPYAATFTIFQRDAFGNETQVYQRTVPANTTQTQNVAGTVLAWDTVDGGLMMGPYRFQAQWPA